MPTPEIRPPARIQYVLDRLRAAGHEAYVVGGCVRDALMGKEPHDWDIATSAEPYRVKDLFFDVEQVDDGLKHGTVMLILDSSPVEVTTFRIDGIYTDGRRPDSVVYTPDITEDLARRDFTINACALGENGIIDPFGGQEDLTKRSIRSVGDPKRRFTEDALRILRGIRFASVLDFTVDDKTAAAMLSCRHLLKNVSQERITAEFIKILSGSNVYRALSQFREILVLIVPEIQPTIGFEQHNPHHLYDVFEHTLKVTATIDPEPILRGAAFFHDLAKPTCFSSDERGIGHFYGHSENSALLAEAVLRRMRLSEEYIRAVTELVRFHGAEIGLTDTNIKKWLNRIGEPALRRLLLLKRADALAQNPVFAASSLECIERIEAILNHLLAQSACYSLRDLAVNGSDLIQIGIPEGPKIGILLDHLLSLVLDNKLQNSPESLLREAAIFWQKTK